jgi:hypothetical protein
MIDRPAWRARAAGALLGALVLGPWSVSRAERDQRPSLLLGGTAPPVSPDVALDPRLPTGASIPSAARPTSLSSVACGWLEPVCVHHDARVSPELARTYLVAFEQARARLVHALGLPAPLADMGLGSTPGLDLYLSESSPLDVSISPDPAIASDDRRSAFCVARPAAREIERQVTLCVGEAVLLGLDAAETPFIRRGIATYWWGLVGMPSARDLDAVDFAQANPQLCATARDRASPDASAGAALFFDYLDARLGAGQRGMLPAALLQISRAATAPGRLRFDNEPDVFDVLYRAFAASSETFEDFMLGFAVERAFVGSRDPGQRHPELAWLGDAGRVRFDWVLEASSLPRRVAPRRPLEPMGAAYIWLDLDRVTLNKQLAFRAEWETPGVFRWSLVSVDARGQPLRRFDLPLVKSASSAERMVGDVDGAVGVLIVGTNLGGIDLAHPFDPDHEPFEAHGFTVYVTEL